MLTQKVGRTRSNCNKQLVIELKNGVRHRVRTAQDWRQAQSKYYTKLESEKSKNNTKLESGTGLELHENRDIHRVRTK